MPKLNPLLESDNIECAHKGKIVAFSNNKLLEVDGSCVLTKQDLLQAQIIGCTHQVAGFSTPCKAIVTILDSALSNTLIINGDSAIIAQQISQIFTDNGTPLRFAKGTTPKAKDIFELDEDIADFDNAQNSNENAKSISESSAKSSENLDTKSNEIFTPLPQRYASNDDMAIYEDFISNTKRHTTKKYPLAHSPLADLIGQAESQNKYTMCNHKQINSKGKEYYGAKDLKELTMLPLSTIIQKQQTKEIFAAGRFQVTKNTLLGAKNALNLNDNDLYNEEMQDRIFEEYLIDKKRPDVMKYLKGNGDIDKAAYALAMEFASIGVKYGWELDNYPKGIKRVSNGKQSFYENIKGNKMIIRYENIIQALKETKKQMGGY
ncbi:hypothetical protein [Helicobacter sp. T3_23-1059]